MASSLGTRCGGNLFNADLDHRTGKLSVENWSGRSLILGSNSRKTGRIAMSATATASDVNGMSFKPIPVYGFSEEKGRKREGLEAQERLDEMMRDSVVEIVKNLKEAPLLVQVYCENRGENETTSLRTGKKAKEEDWPITKEKWENGESPSPEGVIFVEELPESEAEEESATRAWGVLVQGKGAGCGPVCYLLKTSRAGSGPGLGLCCTHFCLVRVKNFRETAKSQLKNCWLTQGQ